MNEFRGCMMVLVVQNWVELAFDRLVLVNLVMLMYVYPVEIQIETNKKERGRYREDTT